MNKRILAAIAALAMGIAVLTGCGEEPTEPTTSAAVQKQEPKAENITAEEAENSIGRRFRYTLDELTELIDEGFPARSYPLIAAQPGGWQLLSDGLVDDSGAGYSSYYIDYQGLTLTAAVEKESGKVINIGCGFSGTIREKPYPSVVAGVMAAQAGGFDQDEAPFFSHLFSRMIKKKGNVNYYYDGLMFTKSEERTSVVLLIAPCTEESAEAYGVPFYHMTGNTKETEEPTETIEE